MVWSLLVSFAGWGSLYKHRDLRERFDFIHSVIIKDDGIECNAMVWHAWCKN